MDVGSPISSVIPTLDGPILQVLAKTTRPLTGREVHQLAAVGSESGIRLALTRLAHHGLVHATPAGKATLYTVNRDHIAWHGIDLLTKIRQHLLSRIADTIGSWEVPPVTAAMFGSSARGDGNPDSDIDILLIAPPETSADIRWSEQVDTLRDQITGWTGNTCQIYEITEGEYDDHIAADEPLINEWRRDAIVLFGSPRLQFQPKRRA